MRSAEESLGERGKARPVAGDWRCERARRVERAVATWKFGGLWGFDGSGDKRHARVSEDRQSCVEESGIDNCRIKPCSGYLTILVVGSCQREEKGGVVRNW